MNKIITINQLIEKFKDFSKDNNFLKDFGYGPTSEISTSRQMKFPYLWITHSQPSTIRLNEGLQMPTIRLTFIIVDQINNQINYKDINGNDSNNVQEIISDTFQISQDLVSFSDGLYSKQEVLLVDEDIPITVIMDETTDKVSGVSLDISYDLYYINCNDNNNNNDD